MEYEIPNSVEIFFSFIFSVILIYIGYWINKEIKIRYLKKYLIYRIIKGLKNFPNIFQLLNEFTNKNTQLSSFSNILIMNDLPKDFVRLLIELDFKGIIIYGDYLEFFVKCSIRIGQINETLKSSLFEMTEKKKEILITQSETAKAELIEFAFYAILLLRFLAKNNTQLLDEISSLEILIKKLEK